MNVSNAAARLPGYLTARSRLSTEHFKHAAMNVTQRNVYTQKLLHREAFTRRNFYTEQALSQRTFYTQKLLHREAFTQSKLCHREAFTHSKLLHREDFTESRHVHREPITRDAFTIFYTQQALHKVRPQSMSQKKW